MGASPKRATIYLPPEIHRALKIKAAAADSSVSDLVSKAGLPGRNARVGCDSAGCMGDFFAGGHMLYMIVENFRAGDAIPVYRRFRDRGRLAPDGLRYVASWVTSDFARCFQVMECEDPSLLAQWMARWEDLVEFEVIPVITSPEAAAAVADRL